MLLFDYTLIKNLIKYMEIDKKWNDWIEDRGINKRTKIPI